jgi:integrase/recombinase XerD
MEFTEALHAWHMWLITSTDVAHDTVTEYRATVDRFHRSLGARVAWDQISRDDLTRFLARKVATGPRKGQPVSVNRRRSDIVPVHGFYRFCVLAGILDRDPLALVRLPRRRQGTPRSFTLRQLGVILAGARDDDRLYLLCLLGYAAGLRRAEMAALDLADLDRDPWPGALRVVGKGDRERWVPLSAKLRAAIDRHLGDRRNLTAGPLVANHTHPGRPLKPGTVGDLLANHFRDCGIEVGSAHWLRHSAATAALTSAEGTNLEEVREFLGHQDSRTTRGYTSRYAWDVRRRVVEVLPDPEGPLLVAALLLWGGGS